MGDVGGPELSDEDDHHLRRALRLVPGTVFTVCDGRGRWQACTLGTGPGTVEPTGEIHQDPRPQSQVEVAFAPTKGDRPTWAVQKLTEIGVDRIHPMVTARSVVRWPPDRVESHLGKWRQTARAAAAQCRRTWLPEIGGVLTVTEAAGRPGATVAQFGGEPARVGMTTVLIGPEGGWTPDELSSTGEIPRLRLSPFVLRAETAALAAATLLCGLRST